MSAPVNDGTPNRDFVEYDHPEGLYTLEAHVVTPDTEGDVPVAGGGYQSVRAGDVIVRNGNVYDVHSKDAWSELGLVGQRDQEDLPQYDGSAETAADFDPSTQDAASVRRYLMRSDVSDEEKTRVANAERDGKNRKSAYPRDWVFAEESPTVAEERADEDEDSE